MFGWQNILVFVIVALAAGYLIRQAWLALAKQNRGCGGCGNKPCDSGSQRQQIVQLDGLKQSPKR